MLLQFPSVDQKVINGLILEIANDKYKETHKHYMFKPKRKRFESWDELLGSMQEARERAYKKPFSYKPTKYPEEPLAKVMLYPGFEGDRMDSTVVQRHPYEQMWKFAVLLHQRPPDDVLDFPNIRQMDMSLSAYDVSPFTKRKSLQEQADIAAARIEDNSKQEKFFGFSR